MTLNKEFFNRPTNITAKVIADSISENGKRITTFELEYHRYIHGELLTNRMFSRNCSSSRAIPISKMIEYTENNMAIPLYWGSAKRGMSAGDEIQSTWLPKLLWKGTFHGVKQVVKCMNKLGLHKQVPNRLLEPWQMMKTVVTATEFDNFFNLRIEGAAQPEIAMLAHKMWLALEDSKPELLKEGQWHLPYVDTLVVEGRIEGRPSDNDQYYFMLDGSGEVHLEDAIKVSAASCAAVSYRTESMTLKKADKIFDMLIKDKTLHASPFENLATPVGNSLNNNNLLKAKNVIGHSCTWEKGVTHVNKDGDFFSGNFNSWIQYRHLLDKNTCYDFKYEERMNEFE